MSCQRVGAAHISAVSFTGVGVNSRYVTSRRGEHTSVDRPSLPDSGEEPCVIGRMHLQQLSLVYHGSSAVAAVQQSRAMLSLTVSSIGFASMGDGCGCTGNQGEWHLTPLHAPKQPSQLA